MPSLSPEGWFDRIWGAVATGTIFVLVAQTDLRAAISMGIIVTVAGAYVGLRILVRRLTR